MPTTPTYPGVYIEEVPSGVHTITGVSTSVTAFLGRATTGSMNKAVRLLSLADYERNFGEPHPKSDLAAAVRLFFQNGGTECYVVRLARGETTAKASVNLKSESKNEVLKVTAKEPGNIGNELAVGVKYNVGNPEGAFDVTISRISGGAVKETESYVNLSMDKSHPRYAPSYITQNSKLVDVEMLVSDATYGNAVPGFSISRRPISAKTKNELLDSLTAVFVGTGKGFKISVDGSSFYDVDLNSITEITEGSNSEIREDAISKIKAAINNALPAGVLVDVVLVNGPGDTVRLKIISATADKKSVTVQQAAVNDLAGSLMLGTDQGGIEVPRYAEFRPAPNGTVFKLADLNTLADLAQNSFNSMTIDGKKVDFGTSLQTSGATAKWYEDGVDDSPTGNSDGIREKFNLMAKAINDAGIGWTAEVWGYRLALLPRSGINNFSSAVTTAAANQGGHWAANVRFYSLGIAGTGAYQSNGVNGLDGNAPTVDDYKGSEDDHTGFYALDLVDIFNLMVIPKDSEMSESEYRSLWAPASAYCQAHRAFLVIDSPESWSDSYTKVTDAGGGINKLRVGVVKDYSAVFYPGVKIRDNGLIRSIGAGGAIAGLMARTDSSRGVWKAPAGMEADIRGVDGLQLTLTDLENGVLNKQGVNCLRRFPAGVVSWGARTLDGADDFASEWKYVPVRRTALYLEESLYRGTQWVVFEPNDEPLWSQIRLNLGAFMHDLFTQGAFQGQTPRDAYFVKCDGETTTQSDINKGIVNILVGFAPLKPAEFVIIKIQQIAGQIQS